MRTILVIACLFGGIFCGGGGSGKGWQGDGVEGQAFIIKEIGGGRDYGGGDHGGGETVVLRSIPNLGYGHMTKKTFVFKKNHGGGGAHGDDFGGGGKGYIVTEIKSGGGWKW
ncbi:glycine-rich cell wall structural protein 1.0-like [Varroa jacobsoni]|uniref:Uncharacterized protein n=1 Tax=Varroa destructor TaxID=109461 RepID=A0A7M7K1W4_VARDE|nr:glycine-rich cell wall structural protein 1.0-like [Varroa destructor]XP_022707446.1 glycine-rich cell wall structural protein 1.0-like [Varroa jacobsoni]